ncbi:MAG TPA: hypothetical protein ENJ96_00090 [Thermodesulfatator atlanticus]|uniref:ATP-grasp domain-containing protein n=1 Tax=Thermodesulfatator atlanticus TaxID=501497 RepID=A0A7V5U1Q5_9BACT|nr:hypothetical protein [Thermodesulfatator atlanticus]
MRPPWIIVTNRAFRNYFPHLGPQDLILGILALKHGEEYLYTDLYARGVKAYPSLLAQYLSRAKCFQAEIFKEFMIPETTVVRDRHDLIRLLNHFQAQGIKEVVTKQNRFNCGLGIHRWDNLETLYNVACFGNLSYPFVVQPFLPGAFDVRVVILGDYVEAYTRKNPHNFRNNLFFGAKAEAYPLNDEELSFCRRVMARGQFPYAHLDLLVTEDGRFFLSEINLRGGLKGARLDQEKYQAKIDALHRAFLEKFLKEHPEAVVKE